MKYFFLIFFCFFSANGIGKYYNNKIDGVITHFDSKKSIFLTIDFCMGKFNQELIDFLEAERIPTTLFLTKRWIDSNEKNVKKLINKDLFSIQNHGSKHKPCVSNGRYVYGIQGTTSVSEIIEEISASGDIIEKLTSIRPKYYRSGTDHYDAVCIGIAKEFDYKILSFSINGDGGAKYNSDQVYEAIKKAKPGDIILIHGNHPEKENLKGIKKALLELKNKGFIFDKLPK